MSQHKEQCGFVTFAQNTDEVDYLELAYLQCLNIKATQQENKYAVIVDAATLEKVNDIYRNTFDYIIPGLFTIHNLFCFLYIIFFY